MPSLCFAALLAMPGTAQDSPRRAVSAGPIHRFPGQPARASGPSKNSSRLPAPSERDLQLPVWNAIYQVRDFSQYVNWVSAKTADGQAIAVQKLDKTTWHLSGTAAGAEIEYEIFADQPGPFGAQLNPHHAFFNLAEILMYPVGGRGSPAEVSFTDLPAGWHIATALAAIRRNAFAAQNYDHLVDAPVEIGTFQESDFDEGGGHYRVVVDADPSDYDMPKIVHMLRRLVSAATVWMEDRPFQTYLFLYHFPRGRGRERHGARHSARRLM